VLLLPGSLVAGDALQAVTARPLHALGFPLLGGLAWDARANTLHLADGTAALQADAAPAAWTVAAEPPIELSALWWFGGGAPAQALPPPSRAALLLHGRSVARGALVPAGPGVGLLIEACDATLPLQAA
jgi:hypothetical protein